MDKFRILKEIGKGNYGKAYLARNINDKNLYVIKTIDKSSFNKDQLNNALYEVDVIKSLQHPYIIKYIESFYENNFLCIVMEYADCGDMSKLVKSQLKLGINLNREEILLNWFVQLCFAVRYIHEKKILHRDLKLSNVFLCSNGDIKLGDFGISKMLSNTDDYAKTLIGTPYYLSPEICLKKAYNQKSDVWSMGCALYELMNLRHPFEAENFGELILKILKGDYDQLKNSFSKELNGLIKDILVTNSDKRPSINAILEKPFLMKYIKMNLIKQLSNKELNIESSTSAQTKNKPKPKDKDNEASLQKSNTNSNILSSNPMSQLLDSKELFNKEKEDNLFKKQLDKLDLHRKRQNDKESIKQIISNLKEDPSTVKSNSKGKPITLFSNKSNQEGIVMTKSYITPDYAWYKTDFEFIVTIELCDVIKDLKCIVKAVEGNYYFKISGMKQNQMKNNHNVICFYNNRKEGRFQVEFTISIKDIQLKEKKCHKFTHENGVYSFYFSLHLDNDEQHFDL